MYGSGRFEFRSQPQRSRITYAVQWLILANVILFAAQLVADIFLGAPVTQYRAIVAPPGGITVDFLAFRSDLFLRGFVWQPLTYMFLHAGLWHLLMNMVVLFFFGPEVERVLSTRQFFRFYFLCGALGVLATAVPPLVFEGSTVSVVGASGACMGVLVAFAVVYPERQVYLFPFPVPIPAWGLVGIILLLNIASAFGNSPISVLTHLGGMATGFAYMKLAPKLRTWLDGMRGRGKKDDMDAMGEAVDNILKFQDKKRKKH